MKPPPFAYAAPDSVAACTALLAQYGDDAKVIAGGQSLMPLLALRMLRPEVVVDIARVDGLDRWSEADGAVRIGAMVRQRALERNAEFARAAPLLAAAMPFIGHSATRSRGTIVGSMCHADPAAELPVCALLLGAEFELASSGGRRVVPARDFFVDMLSTAAAPEELVEAVRIPAPAPGTGFAFDEIARRHGDFALVSCAAMVRGGGDGGSREAIVALGGVAAAPVQFSLAEIEGDVGNDDDRFAEFGRHVAASIAPHDDLHASADYRRAMAAVLVERALAAAAANATEGDAR